MIRVYFDSDVINNIHAGNFPELSDCIVKNRSKLLIPFSQAHIYDKLPSREHDKFWTDIDFISGFTDKKLLNYNKKSKFTRCEIASVREVFEAIDEGMKMRDEFSNFDNIVEFFTNTINELKEGNYGSDSIINQEGLELFNEFQNTVNNIDKDDNNYKDLIQEAMDRTQSIEKDPQVYKEHREAMWQDFRLPSHFCDLDLASAIEQIDEKIQERTDHSNFLEFARVDLKKEEMDDAFLHYIQCYTTLGNIGYHSDKIDVKRGKGFQNHLNDSMHSFFGAHSDYFVVLDKKLKAKTKLLYKVFNIRTQVVSPKEFIAELKVRLENNTSLEDVLGVIEQDQPIDYLFEEGIPKFLYRLKHYFLDYFTHVQIEKSTLTEPTKVLFSKQYANYSSVLFFEEFDSVIRMVNDFFNISNIDDAVLSEFRTGMIKNGKHSKDYVVGELLHSRLISDGREFYFSISIFNKEQITTSEV